MSEENEAIEEEIAEAAEDDDGKQDERKGHGPGFRLGLVVGLIAGAAGATLFAPPTGEEQIEDQTSGVLEPAPQDVDLDSAVGRIRALLDHVRARVLEASREAEIAARETEELAHARYAELTRQNGSGD